MSPAGVGVSHNLGYGRGLGPPGTGWPIIMEVKQVAVVGAGLMGRGIAHVAAVGGYDTALQDVSDEILNKALAAIKEEMMKAVARNKLTKAQVEEALARIRVTTELSEAVKGAQVVIEAVPEEVELKWQVYKEVDASCSRETAIATNTSALSITELGSVISDPSRFVGMHFFNPVHKMKLVEVVRGLETSDEACQIAFEVARRMGKEPIEVNEAPGFVTSRINVLIGNEAFYMLQEGVASAEDIDKALKLGLNHPMGPFELVDLVGLDTRLHVLEYLHRTLGEKFRPCPLMVKYVKAGRLGRKVGKGVYDYTQGT